jgi:hypothetical protein
LAAKNVKSGFEVYLQESQLMLYLKASQSNTITVTWTERANSATVYRLRLTNLATLEATDIYLNAIDNLSSYESRYDKFAFTLGALEKGQYRYEVTENPATYAAGDFVQGGLYTFTDSGYAYITAAVDQSSNAEWGCPGTLIPEGATPEAIGQGIVNTASIVATCATAGISARLANDLVLNNFSDWFLPSLEELGMMWTELASDGLGGFANHIYWSSTQASDTQAFTVDMNNGNQGTHSKGNTSNRYTRAMRRFLLPTTNPRVLETGLAFVELGTETYLKQNNTIDYAVYNN